VNTGNETKLKLTYRELNNEWNRNYFPT